MLIPELDVVVEGLAALGPNIMIDAAVTDAIATTAIVIMIIAFLFIFLLSYVYLMGLERYYGSLKQ
jgi:hypothetical protein